MALFSVILTFWSAHHAGKASRVWEEKGDRSLDVVSKQGEEQNPSSNEPSPRDQGAEGRPPSRVNSRSPLESREKRKHKHRRFDPLASKMYHSLLLLHHLLTCHLNRVQIDKYCTDDQILCACFKRSVLTVGNVAKHAGLIVSP